MSIGELVETMKGKPEHILEARNMAEAIHKNRPEVQMEMLQEVKAHLIRLKERDVEQLKTV